MADDPALVFRDGADRAGTHVLLIGIGDYPWLEGGAGCTTPDHHDNAMGMGQLGAPPRSMRALADWFLGEFDNPDRPLASLGLILSEPEPAEYRHRRLPDVKSVPRGTIADVRAAVLQWIERSNARRDNAVIFGFCGHGVQSGDPVLLCRDYGENVEDRFSGSIDFEQFRIALSTKKPDTQLLLVDACRTPDLDKSLLGEATPGDPLLSRSSLTTRGNAPAMQSVHFATSLYTQAWGPDAGPSLFSMALLEGLAGGGADQTADWWVTTTRLHDAVATYLARISLEEGIVQRPEAQSQKFRISRPKRITVPLYVRSLEQGIWSERVVIEARRRNRPVQQVVHVPSPQQASVECALRLTNRSQTFSDVVYNVHALFDPESAFADCSERIIAYPPEVSCSLKVTKRP